ncbi:MATE family efflux transporter [Aliirhizobium smilacinae]|uniref:Uncharacterized protein n=1 Tax=Aliirhizobium smilacinae TaxID=1395944 RepID=A0A5C4X965_9HYPH|nr:MATE family efflux transporter [Rhizobium smilacinae]TNM59907.1 hypothetical protein FHP24_27450 [Rhizobium smilacinae]
MVTTSNLSRPDVIQAAHKTVQLAGPLVSSQFVLLLVNAIPLFLMANFTQKEVAAVALAQAIYMPFVVFGTGVMQAVGIVVAKQLGSKSEISHDKTIIPAVVCIVIIAPAAITLIHLAGYLLPVLGQSDGVSKYTMVYLSIVSLSLPANYLFWTFRSFASARSMTSILLPLGIVAVALEVSVGLLLTRDCGPCLNIGLQGGATALALAQWTLAIGLSGFVLLNRRKIGVSSLGIDKAAVSKILAIGVPIGLAVVLESGFMAILGLIAGTFGEEALAVHGIALQIISVAFAIPLGLGQATTILISRAMGSNDNHEARAIGISSIVVGLGSGALVAAAVMLFADRLFLYYLGEQFLYSPLRFIIFVVAAVHLLDTLQGTGMSLLRGLALTRTALACAVTGYWLVGVACALLLGRFVGFGLYGVWIGFGLGLAVVAALTIHRFSINTR